MYAISINISAFYTRPIPQKVYAEKTAKDVLLKWKTISEYDKQGYIIREIFFKGDLRSDNHYVYSSTDSTLEVMVSDALNTKEKKLTVRYSYDTCGYCSKVEVRWGDSEFKCENNNFIWKDGLLMSEDRLVSDSLLVRKQYVYNSKMQKIKTDEYIYKMAAGSFRKTEHELSYRYEYDEQGRLSQESKEYIDHSAVMTDVCPWSKNALYKYVIKYVYRGKSNLYTKSYFLTEKGKKFYERIRYK